MSEELEKTVMDDGMDGDRMVLCGANAYDKKYYFNKKFEKIPESIQKDLHIICVLFTEEVGGIFTIAFDEDGEIILDNRCDESDIVRFPRDSLSVRSARTAPSFLSR